MHRYPIIAVTAVLTLFSTIAIGQQGPAQGRERRLGSMFDRVDSNRDGKISSEEWKGQPEVFDRLDQNRDGSITQEEAQAARRGAGRGQRGAKMLPRMDKNNDGQISRDEWAGRPEMFERLDQNGDGSITRDEAMAARRPGKGRGQRGAKMFGTLDKNSDGQIGRDEWTRSAEIFDRLDQNKDGSLTREELQMGRRRGKRGVDGSTEGRPPRT
jgi:Ca2+-binding EF-hand superfamily protein